MFIGHPLQERPHLGQLLGADRCRLAAQLLGQLDRPRSHRLPVLDRHADLLEDAPQVVAQGEQPGLVGLPRDLHVEDGLGQRIRVRGPRLEDVEQIALGVATDAHHGMDDEIDPVAVASQLHGHGVDDERHVVADDLHDSVRRLPAMMLELGVVDVYLDLTRRPLLGQVPVRDRRPV